MRIALVSDTYTPQVNGVTTVVVRIANALREFGHQSAWQAPLPRPLSSCGDRLLYPAAELHGRLSGYQVAEAGMAPLSAS